MKKHFLLLFICFVLSKSTFAQKQKADSLEVLLGAMKEDTNKVLFLSKLLFSYTNSKPVKAVQYGEQGLALSRRLGFLRGEMTLLNRMGEYHQRQGNYAQGIESATQSLKVAEVLQDSIGVADANYMLGIIYTDGLKQHDLAMQYMLKALIIYEQKNLKENMANTYNVVAWIYVITEWSLHNAAQYVDKSIRIANQTKNEQFLGYYLGTKALIYDKQGKLDSALLYFRQANILLEKIDDKAIIAYGNVLSGDIYTKQGKYTEALTIYQQAVAGSKEVNAKEFLKEAYHGIAKVYALQKQYDRAYEYQNLYIQLRDSIFNREINQKVIITQNEYEKEKQEIKIALLEKEKILIEEEKRVYVVSFAGGILSALLVIFLIIRNNRQRSKANKLLQGKNEEIEARNKELHQTKEEIETQNEELHQSKEEIGSQRDILARQNEELVKAQDTIVKKNREIKLRNYYLEKVIDERTHELKSTVQDLLKQNQDLEQFSYIISHNLRSPVARIQGLVNIFNQENMNDEFNKQILLHLHQSSYDLDTVIKDLTEIVSIRKSLNTNKELVDINELIDDELRGLDSEIKRTEAIIEKDLAVNSIYSIKAYMQSIVHHLIANAIKYRNNSCQLHISIKTSKENNYFCLTVQDNGLGVDTTDLYKIFGLYQRMHTHVEGKGLGLYFVKTQIEAMNGKIELESIISQGSTFKVYLPL